VFEKNRKNYGTRRIKLDPAEIGEIVSRPRISRLMKEQGLQCKNKRKFKATTNSKHDKPVAPNHLDSQFQVSCPDTVYVGDITSIPTGEGWLYLAVLIDFLFTLRGRVEYVVISNSTKAQSKNLALPVV